MNSESVTAYVGLGSNLGDRRDHLDQAIGLIGQVRATKVCQVSAYQTTHPLAGADQPEYLNAVAKIQTTLSALELFAYLRRIEDCFEKFFMSRTKEELFREAVKRGIQLCPVNTVADLLQEHHLQAREFWTDIDLAH